MVKRILNIILGEEIIDFIGKNLLYILILVCISGMIIFYNSNLFWIFLIPDIILIGTANKMLQNNKKHCIRKED